MSGILVEPAAIHAVDVVGQQGGQKDQADPHDVIRFVQLHSEPWRHAPQQQQGLCGGKQHGDDENVPIKQQGNQQKQEAGGPDRNCPKDRKTEKHHGNCEGQRNGHNELPQTVVQLQPEKQPNGYSDQKQRQAEQGSGRETDFMIKHPLTQKIQGAGADKNPSRYPVNAVLDVFIQDSFIRFRVPVAHKAIAAGGVAHRTEGKN
ncbi:hypothetical protein SDC9_161085 [bioreactor metagenome]|uniref:Uncharacterized protein n=1 Tax=bioreactor metagenome TaxID=1076179 RepID=A0A645FK93_9ZZZZ